MSESTYPEETFSLKHEHSKTIAEQNDAFRKKALSADNPNAVVVITDFKTGNKRMLTPHENGLVRFTPGFDGLDDFKKMRVIEHIKKQDAFEEGNDPYGEHDFGSVHIVDYPKVFWKIEYYASNELQYGTDTPQAPDTFRVLTVMLAEEY